MYLHASLRIRDDARFFLYLFVFLNLTLPNYNHIFDDATLVPIHHPILLAFVHINLWLFLIHHTLLSEASFVDLFRLFLFITNHFHALGHHVLARAKQRTLFSGSGNLFLRDFLGTHFIVVTENFVEVGHHSNHNIVERACVDKISWLYLFRSENIRTNRDSNVVVSHLVVRLLLHYCPTEVNDKLQRIIVKLR